MKIKHLIMVSLMLAVLTIGAVSASEDIASDDDLAASEITEDAVGELPSDEIIAGEEVQDELGADEDAQDALELEASDFDVNVTEEISLDDENVGEKKVISIYCPEGSEGGDIRITCDKWEENQIFAIPSGKIGGIFNLFVDDLEEIRFGGIYPISVSYFNSSVEIPLTNATLKVTKTIDADDFSEGHCDESSVANWAVNVWNFPVKGNLVVYVDGKESFSKEVFPWDDIYVYTGRDLNITKSGQYAISVKFKTGWREDLEIVKFNLKVPLAYCTVNSHVLLNDNVIYSSSFLDNGTVVVYVNDTQRYSVNVTPESEVYLSTEDLNITSMDKYDILVKFKYGDNEVELAKSNLSVKLLKYRHYASAKLSSYTFDVSDVRVNGTLMIYVDGEMTYSKNLTEGDYVSIYLNDLNITTVGKYDVLVKFKPAAGDEFEILNYNLTPTFLYYESNDIVDMYNDDLVSVWGSAVNGTLILYCDGKECSSMNVTPEDEWICFASSHLKVNKTGRYNVTLTIKVNNTEYKITSFMVTVEKHDGLMYVYDEVQLTNKNDKLAKLETYSEKYFNGTVTVSINGKEVYSKVLNGQDNLTYFVIYNKDVDLSGIGYDEYIVTVTYMENGTKKHVYEAFVNFIPYVEIYSPRYFVAGQKEAIYIYAPKGLNGTASLWYYDVKFVYDEEDGYDHEVWEEVDIVNVKIVDGFARIPVDNLTEGRYDYGLRYDIANYHWGSESINLYVRNNTQGYTSTVSSQNITEGEDVLVTLAGPTYGKNVVVYIDGLRAFSYPFNLGEMMYCAENLTAGDHYITLKYRNDLIGISYSTTYQVTVNAKPEPVDPNLAIGAIGDVALGSDVTVVITADEKFTGTVNVQVGSVNTTANIINGKGNMTVSTVDFALGETAVKVTSASSDLFIAGSAEAKFNVTAKQENVTPVVYPAKIDAKDLSAYYNKDSYSVTVYGTDGNVAAGVEVIFKVNGKKVGSAKTNAKGVATIKLKQLPKTYKITSEALGETVTKKLTVKQVLKLKKVKVKKSAKKLAITATLKEGKKAIKGKKITFKFNGKKYTAKTNKKGVAKITVKKSVLKKLKVGKKVKYQATYIKDTVKKSVKVKK